MITQEERLKIYKEGHIITSKTVELLQAQLIAAQYVTQCKFISPTVETLGTAKYYGKSQLSEVKDIWYNYDYPEN